MEKKLTDEEIVKALVHCSSNCSCEYCYHNDEVGSGEIVCRARLMIKAIDLIHRLQDENAGLLKENEELTISYHGVQHQAAKRIVELTKQVDKLTNEKAEQEAEIERLKNFIDFKTANVMCDKCKQQAVKDTAKAVITDMFKEIEGYERIDRVLERIAERYGVEVENEQDEQV